MLTIIGRMQPDNQHELKLAADKYLKL